MRQRKVKATEQLRAKVPFFTNLYDEPTCQWTVPRECPLRRDESRNDPWWSWGMPLSRERYVHPLPFTECRGPLSFLSFHSLENRALSGKAAVPSMWRMLHKRTWDIPPGRMQHAGTLAVSCPARTAGLVEVPHSSLAMCEAKSIKGKSGSLDTVAGQVTGHRDDGIVEGMLPTS